MKCCHIAEAGPGVAPCHKIRELGFTLVELMIALTVGGVIMAGVMTAFMSQHRSYLAQDDVVEMQQNIRVAMDMLVRDVRSAGYDPNGLGAAITVAGPNTLIFTRDDSTGVLETVDYSLFDAFAFTLPASNDGLVDDLALQINASGRQVVAENISQMEFNYLDEDGNALPFPINLPAISSISSVQISLLAVASGPDPSFNNVVSYQTASGAIWGPFNDNLRRRMLITTVKCRNLGI